MVTRFRVVPAAYVLLRRGDEVLLQRRQGTGYMDGYWACAAAGHVEAGESVLRSACREAAEELAITVRESDLLPLTVMHRTQANHDPIDERVDFFFACQRWSGSPRLAEPEKAAELGWFSLDALPDIVVPHERYVLDRCRGGDLAQVVSFGFEASRQAPAR